MKFEVIAYYQNISNGFPHKENECSVPVREISKEDAEQFKNFLELSGARRHETKTQIFYTVTEDARHSREYIFYK